MNSIVLFLGLLWRTLVAYFAIGLIGLTVIALFRMIGIDLLPQEVTATGSYIKLKSTLMHAAFAAILLSSEIGLPANLVRLIGGAKLNLSKSSWRNYAFGLSAISFALAILNALVAAFASFDAWLNYKTFSGLLLLIGIFLLANRIARNEKNGR